ncbi:predicted protein [Postia placenta Mad-698-R]|nr:predicted protein [Postia placenta Mad-698-R]
MSGPPDSLWLVARSMFCLSSSCCVRLACLLKTRHPQDWTPAESKIYCAKASTGKKSTSGHSLLFDCRSGTAIAETWLPQPADIRSLGDRPDALELLTFTRPLLQTVVCFLLAELSASLAYIHLADASKNVWYLCVTLLHLKRDAGITAIRQALLQPLKLAASPNVDRLLPFSSAPLLDTSSHIETQGRVSHRCTVGDLRARSLPQLASFQSDPAPRLAMGPRWRLRDGDGAFWSPRVYWKTSSMPIGLWHAVGGGNQHAPYFFCVTAADILTFIAAAFHATSCSLCLASAVDIYSGSGLGLLPGLWSAGCGPTVHRTTKTWLPAGQNLCSAFSLSYVFMLLPLCAALIALRLSLAYVRYLNTEGLPSACACFEEGVFAMDMKLAASLNMTQHALCASIAGGQKTCSGKGDRECHFRRRMSLCRLRPFTEGAKFRAKVLSVAAVTLHDPFDIQHSSTHRLRRITTTPRRTTLQPPDGTGNSVEDRGTTGSHSQRARLLRYAEGLGEKTQSFKPRGDLRRASPGHGRKQNQVPQETDGDHGTRDGPSVAAPFGGRLRVAALESQKKTHRQQHYGQHLQLGQVARANQRDYRAMGRSPLCAVTCDGQHLHPGLVARVCGASERKLFGETARLLRAGSVGSVRSHMRRPTPAVRSGCPGLRGLWRKLHWRNSETTARRGGRLGARFYATANTFTPGFVVARD